MFFPHGYGPRDPSTQPADVNVTDTPSPPLLLLLHHHHHHQSCPVDSPPAWASYSDRHSAAAGAGAGRRSTSCDLDPPPSSPAPGIDGQDSSPHLHRSPSKKTKRRASYGHLRHDMHSRAKSPLVASSSPPPSSSASPSSSSRRFLPKQSRNFPLPPLESLGIAIPSPNSSAVNLNGLQRTETPKIAGAAAAAAAGGEGGTGGGKRDPRDPPRLVTDLSSVIPHSDPSANAPFASRPYPQSLPITPPEYDDSVRWHSHHPTTTTAAAIAPFPVSQPPPSFERSKSPVQHPFGSDADARSTRQFSPDLTPTSDHTARNVTPSSSPSSLQEDDDLWLKNGYAAAVSSLEISTRPGEAVQLVSQSLPCPPPDSSVSGNPRSAFVPIVQAIQDRLQPGQSPYISIVHAVPPKFSLSNLPTSPPSTPNLLSAADDYFNLTVFSSATVSSYPHTDLSASPVTAKPPYMTAPIVPPYSVHVAVVERYLPPPTPQEYDDLFSPRGPSVLVDRLLELSPNDGTLVFIYPTKQGAQTFQQHYLSPILDPLLRHSVVVNGLSADVGMALGHMAAIPHMDDFEALRFRIAQLCRQLNDRDGDPIRRPPTRSHFDVIYAAKGKVHVDRKLWTEWHIHQDTPRIRNILGNYWRNRYRYSSNDSSRMGARHPADTESATMLRELVEGIRRRSKSERNEPQQKLELGVFVIRRSRLEEIRQTT
ncbi:hypothetical protein VTO42DRAFT_1444 [Malbranchea cinnamomea]